MIKYYLYTVLISLMTFQLCAQEVLPFIHPTSTMIICEGEDAEFELLGSENEASFSWELFINNSWELMDHFEKSINLPLYRHIILEIDTLVFRCKVIHKEEIFYTPISILVIDKPDHLIISMDHNCIRNVIKLNEASGKIYEEYFWVVNEADTFCFPNPEFINKTSVYFLHLETTNSYGCISDLDTILNPLSVPQVAFIMDDKFGCGNSTSLVFANGLDSILHSVNVECFNLDGINMSNRLIKKTIVKNDSLLIEWNVPDNTLNLKVNLTYTDIISNCSKSFEDFILLTNAYAPSQGKLEQKPNTSTGLLFYVHDNPNDNSNLLFDWGYTDNDSRISNMVQSNSIKNYYDFGSMSTNFTYWVKVYFQKGCNCKTQIFFSGAK